MVRVYRSTVFDAPVDEVWAIIRDFDDWAAWFSSVKSSRIEDGRPSDSVGNVRAVTTSGGIARERLLGLSDHEHTITYSIEETQRPLRDYVAEIRLRSVTDGARTFAEWSGSFDVPSDEAMIADAIASVYEDGFAGVRRLLGDR